MQITAAVVLGQLQGWAEVAGAFVPQCGDLTSSSLLLGRCMLPGMQYNLRAVPPGAAGASSAEVQVTLAPHVYGPPNLDIAADASGVLVSWGTVSQSLPFNPLLGVAVWAVPAGQEGPMPGCEQHILAPSSSSGITLSVCSPLSPRPCCLSPSVVYRITARCVAALHNSTNSLTIANATIPWLPAPQAATVASQTATEARITLTLPQEPFLLPKSLTGVQVSSISSAVQTQVLPLQFTFTSAMLTQAQILITGLAANTKSGGSTTSKQERKWKERKKERRRRRTKNEP
jgi:hypothetical protein